MHQHAYAVQRLTTDVSRTFKPTHVKTLIEATYSNAVSMSELFSLIGPRLRHDKWIIEFKALSLIHLLLREGNSHRILGYLCSNIDILYQSFFKSQAPEMTNYIKTYSHYLEEKAGAFRILKNDWVKDKDAAVVKFRTIEDHKELLKEVEILQKQSEAAIECNWDVHHYSDVVLIQGYTFMIAEIISLFHLSNEAIIRVLGLYFEMEKPDAAKALGFYKTFTNQNKKMTTLFDRAKKIRGITMLDIPEFKTPPLSLVNTLESYLNSPDFETQRKAYINKKKAPNQDKKESGAEKSNTKSNDNMPLIDFFDTVQTEMAAYNGSKSPQIPEFSALWNANDEFSKQAASVNEQIFQTEKLLKKSTISAFNENPVQNPFNQMNVQGPQITTPAYNQTAAPNLMYGISMNQGAYNPFQSNMQPAIYMKPAFDNTNPFPTNGQNAVIDPFLSLRNNTVSIPVAANAELAPSNPSNPAFTTGFMNQSAIPSFQSNNLNPMNPFPSVMHTGMNNTNNVLAQSQYSPRIPQQNFPVQSFQPVDQTNGPKFFEMAGNSTKPANQGGIPAFVDLKSQNMAMKGTMSGASLNSNPFAKPEGNNNPFNAQSSAIPSQMNFPVSQDMNPRIQNDQFQNLAYGGRINASPQPVYGNPNAAGFGTAFPSSISQPAKAAPANCNPFI